MKGVKRFVRTINRDLLRQKMKTRIKKPPKCCHPNCFECPYTDCRYDRLEVEDYTESNNRDYFLFEDSRGRKLHKPSDREYRNARQTAYKRKNRKYVDRHNYNKQYYEEYGEEIKAKKREDYDTTENTRKCRKWYKRHKADKKVYDKTRYEANKEQIKARARERYYKKKQSESAEKGSEAK